jgi:hypothetical protein
MYFTILVCLMPDNFAHQGESAIALDGLILSNVTSVEYNGPIP